MKRNGLEIYHNVTRYILVRLTISLFIVVIFLQSLNIFFRYTNIAYSIVWVEEFTRYSFIWIAFLLWPLADRNGSHFTVDIFFNKLKNKKKIFLEIIIDLLAICFVSIVVWYSFKYIPIAMLYHTESIRWLRMGIVYLVIPIGLIFVFIERMLMLLTKISGLIKNPPEEKDIKLA